MNYGVDENGMFIGELPDGTITHDQSEFYDKWAEENYDLSYEQEEDWT